MEFLDALDEEEIEEMKQYDTKSLNWTGLTPEEEEQISKKYGEELPERWESVGIVYHNYIEKRSKNYR